MSSIPTRVDLPVTASDPGSPLPQQARVLELISRQRPLPALLAFSGLHQEARNRRLAAGHLPDRDWLEERFALDEVLQLICDRIHTITRADGVVIALTESSNAKRARMERAQLECRASAGPLAVLRNTLLPGESEFLQDCLESGRILRCDDCEVDARVESDFARHVGARSSVLIPLRGRRQTLGVLQIFSRTPWNFSEQDVRCFDLFAELILSALKPEDEDRRIGWLTDVASDVLRPNLEAERPNAPAAPALELAMQAELPASPAATVASTMSEVLESAAWESEALKSEVELPAAEEEDLSTPPETTPTPAETTIAKGRASLLFFPRLHPPHRDSSTVSSHPGLSVVMGLVAVAALFSAGAWWGMQVHGDFHGKAEAARIVAAGRAYADAATVPPAITTSPAPPANALSAAGDNLMTAAQTDSGPPLTAVTEDKLAALPKVMGLRHWSSSVGSTVVIDMEDQVPYEVHRLMSPERIYFDLHDTALARELDGKTLDVDDPSLTRVRVAQPVAGLTRVVLDTKDGSNFSVSMESSPYRLVVELRGGVKTVPLHKSDPVVIANSVTNSAANSDRNLMDRTAAAPKAAPVAALTAKGSQQPLPARAGKFRIVLDAGHGGWDLGTVGRQGLLEKDLVLDVTERLGRLLQARLGSEVMFTRTDDTYLPLEQRADFANQAQADLFVSVHANYSTSAAARGVETYYTDLFSAPGSRESGSRESGSRESGAHEAEKHDDGSSGKLTPVSLSLGGLREKTEESRRLASSIQRSLHSALAAQSPTIRDRGIKDSAFVVLTGTIMPSILTEISFVSSPADERNLQSAAYRQQIAEALYQGIARYEQSSSHTKVAQLQTSARR